jgi:hypothetical protein
MSVRTLVVDELGPAEGGGKVVRADLECDPEM